MSSITIRNLDPAIKERLRVRAAEHGHSMEAEARRILQTALSGPGRPKGHNLYEGVDLELPPRDNRCNNVPGLSACCKSFALILRSPRSGRLEGCAAAPSP